MMDEVLTCDAFLGGRLRLWQPAKGYRAGVDPVLLAAAVPARAGQSLLDLGCGAGTAALCVGARVAGLRLSGLELQPEFAALAHRNAEANGQSMTVVEGDLAEMPEELRTRQFDHVICNPPYFDRGRGTAGDQSAREAAMGEQTPLTDWIRAAARRTRPGGWFHMIQRAERLPDFLGDAASRFGSLQLLPLTPRSGRDSQLVILRARKGGRAEFRLHAGMIVHDGAVHDGDRESYSAPIRAVLRDGAALPFPK